MKLLSDYTLEDAMNDYEDGFDVICQDGHVSCVSNMDYEETMKHL